MPVIDGFIDNAGAASVSMIEASKGMDMATREMIQRRIVRIKVDWATVILIR